MMRPKLHAFVTLRTDPAGGRGVVIGYADDGTRLQVRWGKDGQVSQLSLDRVETGFKPGDEVFHRGNVEGAPSLGQGTVLATRRTSGPTQHLVYFWHLAESRWLPWHRLEVLRGIRHTFRRGPVKDQGAAEALRVRNLAHALEQWNATTGGLTRLEIDPLPHQIHLVHTILSSGNLNWLIADDVGLGKTIEVGLLLAALQQRGMRRTLLVVPAGLTRQWQEEMRDKFRLEDFVIYGEDILPDNPAHWRMYDHVIISVDRAKRDTHREALAMARPWDLVIFDEAHWLTKREYGHKFERTERYRLAEQLRGATSAVLLLSGTPHQGKDDQFRGLLELLRPGKQWSKVFRRIHDHPKVLASMVVRNRKADVTDKDGNFIFKGKTSNTIRVAPSSAELAFDRELQAYLLKGYAGGSAKGYKGMPVQFVMTTYRKLASSSIAAIAHALHRRHERLTGQLASKVLPSDEREVDERFVELDEFTTGEATEFFAGELDVLVRLIRAADTLVLTDTKVAQFFDTVIPRLLDGEPTRHVLIFTEYRSTQDALVSGLAERFGHNAVGMIRGGQAMSERRHVVDRFSDSLQFLVSTEAGGEGLNLQANCNVMVNFDLPWNPMRLVQRVGRLYRYGQDKRVVVFNVSVAESIDQSILGGMYDRLEAVARDMAAVTNQNRDGLIEDILGQLVGALDVDQILADAATATEERTQERIEEALRMAKESARNQDELLQYAAGFDPEALEGSVHLTVEHLVSFTSAMFARTNIEIVNKLYNDAVWEIRLPEALQLKLGQRHSMRIAFDRNLARRAKAALMDAEEPLLRYLLSEAKDVHGPGRIATLALPPFIAGRSGLLRWLNETGRPVRTQYACALINAAGEVEINGHTWEHWLLTPCEALTMDAAAHNDPTRVYRQLGEALAAETARGTTDGTYADEPYDVSAFWGAIDRR